MPSPIIVDDPEKGTMEQVEQTTTIPMQPTPRTNVSRDARIVDLTHSAATDPEKKPTELPLVPLVEANKPAAPKKLRKVSRWIRFQLWFNTYR